MKSIVSVKRGFGVNGRRAMSLSEEARHLWTRLSVIAKDRLPTTLRIGFCSTHSGEGTTSVATNFAICLGQQGLRTCLVEANLRRPVLSAHFKRRRHAGLSELLSDEVVGGEVVIPGVAPSVDLLVAGTVPPDIYAQLSKTSMAIVFERLVTGYDALIVDVPALSTSPEAGLILLPLDAAVLVVEANKTRKQNVARSLSTLSDLGVPFAGAVINKMTYDLPVLLDRVL